MFLFFAPGGHNLDVSRVSEKKCQNGFDWVFTELSIDFFRLSSPLSFRVTGVFYPPPHTHTGEGGSDPYQGAG